MPEPKSQETPKGESREEIIRRAGPLLGIGATFLASIAVCMGGGWLLDRAFGTLPWLTIAGSILGIVTGFYLFFRTVASVEGGDHGEWSE